MSTSLARAWLCGLALGFPALASAGCGGEGQSARESTASAAELDEMAALGYLDRDLEPSNARAAGVTRWERGRTSVTMR